MGQFLNRPSNDFLIRRATSRDVISVCKIAEKRKRTSHRLDDSLSGFLISDFSFDQYRAELNNGVTFWVLSASDQVVSFLIAYKCHELHDDNPYKEYMDSLYSDYWYVFQIATDPEFASRGYGRALYAHFFTVTAGLPIFASVVTEPPNYRSYHMHMSLGFNSTEFQVGSVSQQRILLFRPAVPDLDELKEQYSIAKDLYVHEDNLNWTKIATFFSVTAIFIASFGFTDWNAKLFGTVHAWLIHSTLVNIAICIMSLVFGVSLRSGVHYMNIRKRSFIEIDQQLSRVTANRIVTPAPSALTTLSIIQLPITIAKVTGGLAVISAVSALAEAAMQLTK
ncbi:MAG: GNAT family N-acetyltransferase [Xenococcus sp. MO_188.B8]|nr:GNAT family N-acetyltransferase [Xenococcus sp. MO_188.B8]